MVMCKYYVMLNVVLVNIILKMCCFIELKLVVLVIVLVMRNIFIIESVMLLMVVIIVKVENFLFKVDECLVWCKVWS